MAERTILLRKGALGDVVLLGSVTAAIAGPVTVVTAPRYAPIARRLVGVDEVLPWDAPLPAGRVVDLQGGLRGVWRAPFADRVHKHGLRRRLRLWTGLGAARPDVPRIYARAVGVDPARPPWIRGGPLGDALALLPGASVPLKQWAVERFAEVGRAWGGQVIVFGGPGEAALVAAVVGGVPGAEAVVDEGFDATLAALGRCRVAVANDSGPMHLAGALGLPVVALFGPTHPDDGFFVYPGEVVQRGGLRCRPCALHRPERCRVGDRRCLDLPSRDVIAAVRRCAG